VKVCMPACWIGAMFADVSEENIASICRVK
jgi:hypothetical protein